MEQRYERGRRGERERERVCVCVCVFEVGGSGMGDNEFGLGMQRSQSVLGQDDWRRIGGSGRCKDQSPPFSCLLHVTLSLSATGVLQV